MTNEVQGRAFRVLRLVFPLGLAILLGIVLAGCGQQDTDPGPGGVTVAEARALDEAAQMIEARPLPEEALKEPAAAPDPPVPPEPAR